MQKNFFFGIIIAVIVMVGYLKWESFVVSDGAPNSMDSVKFADFGAWESPLTAAFIFKGADSVSSLSTDNNDLYFIERRASANGRNILVKFEGENKANALTPPSLSVRTMVHEYGGKSYFVDGDDIYYSKLRDQVVYKISGGEPEAITSEGLRYMECEVDHGHNQLICVREDHRAGGEAVNTIVGIDLDGVNEGKILFEGTDFVRQPHISPDGKYVAFITWIHPNMPWDDTQLRIGTLDDDGGFSSVKEVPQEGNVAITNHKYANDGTLYFVADFANWGTLYRVGADGNPELVLDMDVEVGSYDFESLTSAVLTYTSNGLSYVARVNLVTGEATNIGEAFSSASSVNAVSDGVYFTGATSTSGNAIYKIEGNNYGEVYRPSGPTIEAEYLSIPEQVTFPTGDAEEAYGFFYPPKNANFEGTENTLPPLIVKVHGGPVGATRATLDPRIQFWTSRGFAVFDVNHRGSTGYGREFRKKLYPNWGIVDVEDAANGVKYLADKGMVDGDKVVIRGGSAGGYTTLAAMAFQDVFKAGASYFGISDLEVLAKDTHKFESRYLDQLIGAYPEKRDVYLERSPIYSVDKIKSPLLLLQGLDDKVVPPNQSQMIFDALKKNCVPTAYLPFEGEGHGFRQPANNIKAQNSELDFYGQVFGFSPAGEQQGVELIKCGEDIS